MTAVDPRSFDALPAVFDRFAELVGGPLEEYLRARLPAGDGQGELSGGRPPEPPAPGRGVAGGGSPEPPTPAPGRGGRALDLGCGSGRHAVVMAGAYGEVLAVDLSGPMVELARRERARDGITYEQRDLREVTPEADGTFDLVFSAHTLHHVPDLQRALAAIRRLVRPGGQVIVVDNVDDRRQVPREWFVREARRALRADLLRRRRPPREAWETYRLSTHPAWLAHLTTDVFLPPAEWEQIGRSAFPGCEITPMYRARALHWRDQR